MFHFNGIRPSSFFTKKSMTLMEVLIAAIIVSFMMVTLASVQYAMHRLSRDSGRQSTVFVKVAAMAEAVRLSAMHMTGDATNPGYTLSDNQMCFRIDAGIPADYTDDITRCFVIGDRSVAAGGQTTDFLQCDGALANCINLGDLVADTFSCAGACFQPRLNEAAGKYYFEFQLVSRRDPVEGADVDGSGLTLGTEGNPQSFIKYQVYPEMHSF